LIIVPYKALLGTVVFVEDYYDMPLVGLCYYQGRLSRFRKMAHRSNDELYEITILSFSEVIFAKLNQWMFEMCVGVHWSYKNGKQKGNFKGFTPLTKLYFWFKGH